MVDPTQSFLMASSNEEASASHHATISRRHRDTNVSANSGSARVQDIVPNFDLQSLYSIIQKQRNILLFYHSEPKMFLVLSPSLPERLLQDCIFHENQIMLSLQVMFWVLQYNNTGLMGQNIIHQANNQISELEKEFQSLHYILSRSRHHHHNNRATEDDGSVHDDDSVNSERSGSFSYDYSPDSSPMSSNRTNHEVVKLVLFPFLSKHFDQIENFINHLLSFILLIIHELKYYSKLIKDIPYPVPPKPSDKESQRFTDGADRDDAEEAKNHEDDEPNSFQNDFEECDSDTDDLLTEIYRFNEETYEKMIAELTVNSSQHRHHILRNSTSMKNGNDISSMRFNQFDYILNELNTNEMNQLLKNYQQLLFNYQTYYIRHNNASTVDQASNIGHSGKPFQPSEILPNSGLQSDVDLSQRMATGTSTTKTGGVTEFSSRENLLGANYCVISNYEMKIINTLLYYTNELMKSLKGFIITINKLKSFRDIHFTQTARLDHTLRQHHRKINKRSHIHSNNGKHINSEREKKH